MDKVFRIRIWKSGGVIMPSRFSEFKKGNRLIYDDERLYEKKLKQLKRQADLLNKEYCRFAITAEEFVGGSWQVLCHYPENFDYKEHV